MLIGHRGLVRRIAQFGIGPSENCHLRRNLSDYSP